MTGLMGNIIWTVLFVGSSVGIMIALVRRARRR